jgi:hypothetical protein
VFFELDSFFEWKVTAQPIPRELLVQIENFKRLFHCSVPTLPTSKPLSGRSQIRKLEVSHNAQESRLTRNGPHLFLKPLQLVPPCILVGLGRIGIFSAEEPKSEPVDDGLLRSHTVPGPL